jgi:hypothetical protein
VNFLRERVRERALSPTLSRKKSLYFFKFLARERGQIEASFKIYA